MPKTFKSEQFEARTKWEQWQSIADDPVALSDRDKSRNQALQLASYFEGKYDAWCEAEYMAAKEKAFNERGQKHG